MPPSPQRSLLALAVPALALCAAVALAAPAARPAADWPHDWPQWRGPNRDAVSSETGLLAQWPETGPPLLWKSAGLGTGFSSLALAGDRIFTLGDREGGQHLVALNRPTARSSGGRGSAAWEDEFAGPRGTPTVDGSRVYALGTEGDLVCLDAATGKERWRRNLAKDFGGEMMSIWKFTESPLVDGDRLIVTPGRRRGGARGAGQADRQGGLAHRGPADLGRKGKDGAGYSSIVDPQGRRREAVRAALGRGLIGVRADDGKFLWNYNKVANDIANISTPVVKGDHVFASTGYQTGSALLKLRKGRRRRRSARRSTSCPPRRLQNHHGGFVLVGDYIYGGHGHNRGVPICVEMATGKVVWGGEGPRHATTAPARPR